MNIQAGAKSADPALRQALTEDLDRLAGGLIALPGVEAVLLLGSAARGELAMMRLDDRPIYFGDFELMLISQRRLSARSRRQARDLCASYAASLDQPSPRFHIDIAFRERARLAQLPPIVFTHELLACGKVLRGPAVLAGLPQLRASQLDLANTREILFKRLWALAEGWPAGPGVDAANPAQSHPISASLGDRDLDDRSLPDRDLDDRSLGALLWRQPLDLTTVLLPAVGILEAGYACRVELWHRHPDLPFRDLVDRALGLDSGDWLAECLRRRLACEAAEDPAREHCRVLVGLAAGLAWSLQSLGLSEDQFGDIENSSATGELDWIAALAEALPAHSRRLFKERPIARGAWLALARQGLRFSYTLGPRRALRWLRTPRKGHLAAGLLFLHLALAEELAGRPEAALPLLESAGWHARRAAPDAFLEAEAALASAETSTVAAGPEPGDSRDGAIMLGSNRKSAILRVHPSRAWLECRDALGRAFWRNIRLADPGAEPKPGPSHQAEAGPLPPG